MKLINCVPLRTGILTRRGWLAHNEVQAGDETIGFNPATGMSEWTPITDVAYHDDAEVWRIGNGHWHADVTLDHRWWSERSSTRAIGRGLICPECGSEWPTPRGMETHLGRKHHVRLQEVPVTNGAFVDTRHLIGADRLRLAAPADTGGVPGLSTDDAAVLGWLMGDGHVVQVLAKPQTCPECGWLPGHSRKSYRGPVQQLSNSVAVHRSHVHGMTKDRTRGEPAGWDASIYQSKLAQVTRLRALLAHVPHAESTRQRRDDYLPAIQFRLRRAYATDLLKRARWGELSAERFVLGLSPEQRAAWLAAMIDAEGHTRDGFTRIAQNDGEVADAIPLAVYLEGYRPTFSRFRRTASHHKPGGQVGMARPHAAVSMFTHREILERQPVWCVTTELGTWTMEQEGQVMLTG